MSSLALTAHRGAPLTASAIAFYAAAATVVPVLFLAFAVQGRVWQDILRTATVAARISREHGSRAAMVAAHMPIALAYLILTAGLYGEGMSIGALSENSDDPVRRGTVLAAVILLNFAVVGVPLAQFTRTVQNVWSSGRSQPDEEQPSKPQGPAVQPETATPDEAQGGEQPPSGTQAEE